MCALVAIMLLIFPGKIKNLCASKAISDFGYLDFFCFCGVKVLKNLFYAFFDLARVGGGALNKILYGEALPQGPTPYPFIYHF